MRLNNSYFEQSIMLGFLLQTNLQIFRLAFSKSLNPSFFDWRWQGSGTCTVFRDQILYTSQAQVENILWGLIVSIGFNYRGRVRSQRYSTGFYYKTNRFNLRSILHLYNHAEGNRQKFELYAMNHTNS